MSDGGDYQDELGEPAWAAGIDLNAIRRITEAMSKAIAPSFKAMLEAQEAIRASVAPLLKAQQAVSAWVEANRGLILEGVATAQRAIEIEAQALPPNLRALGADEFFRALEVTITDGPCLVWTPRAEIIEVIITGETFAERAPVLVEHRDEILTDLERALAESTAQVLEEQGRAHKLAADAVAAARDRHNAAAQALAAAGLGCVLQEVLAFHQLGAAYKQMSDHDIEETTFQVLALVAIETATSRALLDTDRYTAGFNRHGTLHGLLDFYGEAEMLAALLLLVAWVRELSWLAEREPTFLPTLRSVRT